MKGKGLLVNAAFVIGTVAGFSWLAKRQGWSVPGITK